MDFVRWWYAIQKPRSDTIKIEHDRILHLASGKRNYYGHLEKATGVFRKAIEVLFDTF